MWEDFLDALSGTCLQDEYNKSIRECDVFVMLLSTKVGKYTEEEFEAAFGQFKFRSGKLIYRCVVPCALISPGQFWTGINSTTNKKYDLSVSINIRKE